MKTRLSYFFTDIAVLALVYSVHLLIGAFIVIIGDGRLNDIWGEQTGGNHGPWRHFFPARPLLSDSIMFSLYAIISLAIGYFLDPNRKKLYFLAFTFIFWLMVMGSLNWLID